MATAFETGRKQGYEAGYEEGHRDGKAAGERRGRKTGHDEAVATLLAIYRDRFGNDGNFPTFVRFFRDALSRL